jgi:hypothetical protein
MISVKMRGVVIGLFYNHKCIYIFHYDKLLIRNLNLNNSLMNFYYRKQPETLVTLYE